MADCLIVLRLAASCLALSSKTHGVYRQITLHLAAHRHQTGANDTHLK